MQVIFGKENAELLREKYTLLELETFEVEGKPLETYCLIPAEKIAFSDITLLEHHTKLHNVFVDAVKAKNYKLCEDLYEHLIGKFDGELDSFYEEIKKRFNAT